MRHPVLACIISATVAVVVSVTAIAAVKPDRAIAYRQGIYRAMGWNFGPMSAMVRGKVPFDQADFARRARRIEFYSHQLLEGFPPGSDKGARTDALPVIWENFEDFKSKLKNFQDAAANLASTAQGNDEAASKEAFMNTAKACKACHKKYRAED
ncbi:MAG: cytochrome c [Rhodanobacteraceae bacterium]